MVVLEVISQSVGSSPIKERAASAVATIDFRVFSEAHAKALNLVNTPSDPLVATKFSTTCGLA